jgi:hypothetical protein
MPLRSRSESDLPGDGHAFRGRDNGDRLLAPHWQPSSTRALTGAQIRSRRHLPSHPQNHLPRGVGERIRASGPKTKCAPEALSEAHQTHPNWSRLENESPSVVYTVRFGENRRTPRNARLSAIPANSRYEVGSGTREAVVKSVTVTVPPAAW